MFADQGKNKGSSSRPNLDLETPAHASSQVQPGFDPDDTLGRRETALNPKTRVARFGALSETLISEILHRIVTEELSGDLQVITGRIIRSIYFEKGFAVFAASNLRRDRLGHRLLVAGRLTERDLRVASLFLKGRRIGQAVVKVGLLTQEELGRELVRQAREICVALFGLEQSIYSFDERECAIPMDLRLGVSLYRVQLEGIRKLARADAIPDALPSPATRLRIAMVPPFNVTGEELLPVERQVLELAASGTTIEHVLDGGTNDPARTWKAIYGLLLSGLLERENVRKQNIVQAEIGTFLLSELSNDEVEPESNNLHQAVILELERLQWMSAPEILGLSETSRTEREIESAYNARRREWLTKAKAAQSDSTLAAQCKRIIDRIHIARDELLAQTPRKTKAAAPTSDDAILPTSSKRTSSTKLGVSRKTAPAIKGARPAPSLKRKRPPSTEERLLILTEAAERRRRAHRARLSAPLRLDPSASYDEEVLEPLDVTQEDAELSDPLLQHPLHHAFEEPDEPVDLLRKRRRLLGRIEPETVTGNAERRTQLIERLKREQHGGDRERAISVLYELVEAAPFEAQFQVDLAMQLAGHPVLRKKAERHFRKALSLEPQNANYRCAMGQYYQSFRLEARAVAEYLTALRIDPTHAEASRRLASLGKPTKVSILRKLFS